MRGSAPIITNSAAAGTVLGGAADPVPQRQRLQAALAAAAGDLGGRADADVGRLADLGDQVAGHAGRQAGPRTTIVTDAAYLDRWIAAWSTELLAPMT